MLPTTTNPSLPESPSSQPTGDLCLLDGQQMYRIAHYDTLPPFLMSIVSDADHWMFLSSNGGLTAGRVRADYALFPYGPVDQVHDAHHLSGPRTALRVRGQDGQTRLWEPFRTQSTDHFHVQRNLYKSVLGNSAVFEELNPDLGLIFRYQWHSSREFGWVRTATLHNTASTPVTLDLLDGLLNVLPPGLSVGLQQGMSSLIDAYKRAEVVPDTTLAIYALAAHVSDSATPAEALRATTVWSTGLQPEAVLLSARQIDAFRAGQPLTPEMLSTGQRGAYLIASHFTLPPAATQRWMLAANVQQDQLQVEALLDSLRRHPDLAARLQQDIAQGSQRLRANLASADALQTTADPTITAHHQANVLFNNMRGGVFAHHYDLPTKVWAQFVHDRNHAVAQHHAAFLAALPESLSADALLAQVLPLNDPALERLAYEFLPLTFGRAHGDPSRPWNQFLIRDSAPDGFPTIHYAGNWRDVFQNWEALCLSFPGFLTPILAKFVNAMTIDGFNPIRVSVTGLDWDKHDPTSVWSHFGYWGDHQIVYLLKFLEASERYHPGTLTALLERPIFSYVDVPYTIKPYRQILQDCRHTLLFDQDRQNRVTQRRAAIGEDGCLLWDRHDRVYHVTLAEKLLVPALSKLSNLVLDGGIWMNTQRPEWNDSNNALVGYGLSVVTLCYLRRYMAQCADLYASLGQRDVTLSAEVLTWFQGVHDIFRRCQPALARPTVDDRTRRDLLDALGETFSAYRAKVYAQGFSGQARIPAKTLVDFCHLSLAYVDHSIRANRRPDDLFHAYNILTADPDSHEASVSYLFEMLEGQVAVLSSQLLTPEESLRVINALYASKMYRPDQHSFMLNPERTLPGYLEKNKIPADLAARIPLLAALVEAGEHSVVGRDLHGTYRFAADLRNAGDLKTALDRLQADPRWASRVTADSPAVFHAFEAVFHHKSFTGRASTMYAFEGLGCIYWHMVAKLNLAAQEIYLRARRAAASPDLLKTLGETYYRVRGGLNFNKTPAEYGSFPTDPYSYTPRGLGAQQPGMTGQVKEEILTRFGELGVQIDNGALRFAPTLLQKREFLTQPATLPCYQVDSQWRDLPLQPGTLAFTLCQVPIVYRLAPGPAAITVLTRDGRTTSLPGNTLDPATTRLLFQRTGQITQLEVTIPETEVQF